jgi:hypothetical protein
MPRFRSHIPVGLPLVKKVLIEGGELSMRAESILPFIAQGGSMRPLLHAGSVVFIRRVKNSEISLGDCVAYHVKKRTLIHRVWWKNAAGLWLNDDAGTTALHHVPYRAVLGKVVPESLFLKGFLGWIWGLAFHLFSRLKRRLFPL